jgi:2-polyprenyl-3-methyl-5-hydroxy-6-metoxy-1,4-benzoquinol methylase
MTTLSAARGFAHKCENALQIGLTAVGFGQSQDRMIAESDRYWTDPTAAGWGGNSHWRGTGPFAEDDNLWLNVGRDHWDRFQVGARAAGFDRDMARVVEWGIGGGSNALAFAPYCREIVGVDVSAESVKEAGRQLSNTAVAYLPVQIGMDSPETALDDIGAGTVDAWISYYVLELVPSPAYGLRIMQIAYRLLKPDGLAHVQIKFKTSDPLTWRRGRSYRHGIAQAAPYQISEFWQAMHRLGFEPVTVQVLHKNALDKNYAYFTLRKPSA